MRRARTILHVNQHVIKANRKRGRADPVITVKRGKTNTYAHEAIVCDETGREVGRVVYRPENPLGCGAEVWIQFEGFMSVEPQRRRSARQTSTAKASRIFSGRKSSSVT